MNSNGINLIPPHNSAANQRHKRTCTDDRWYKTSRNRAHHHFMVESKRPDQAVHFASSKSYSISLASSNSMIPSSIFHGHPNGYVCFLCPQPEQKRKPAIPLHRALRKKPQLSLLSVKQLIRHHERRACFISSMLVTVVCQQCSPLFVASTESFVVLPERGKVLAAQC